MRNRIVFIALAAALIAPFPAPAFAVRLLAPGGGAVHALVVGVNEYGNLHGQSLRGARPDAEDLAAVLKQDGVADLTVLLDRDVSRKRFVTEMNRLIAQSKPGDLVFLSYSGHGTQMREYDNWRGYDANSASEQIVLSGFDFKGAAMSEAVVNFEVRAWLARLDAKGVDTVVLWDSCFGGGMRGVEPGSGEIQVRRVHQTADADALTHFPSIEMNSAEARADVRGMTHVTFLAGATDDSVVPEMTGVDPANRGTPRGALSYYVARALEGQLKGGPVSRVELFKYLKQNVSEATRTRQSIDVLPQGRGDPAISGRNVFVLAGDDAVNSAPPPVPPPAPVAPPAPLPNSAAVAPVRLAIVDGPADAFSTIEKHATPLELVSDPNEAELVWNFGSKKAFEHGDMLMDNIDASMIGFVADRVRALSRLREVASNRPLEFGLKSGGAVLTPGHFARAQLETLENAKLTVFNIAADATVQMIYPAAPDAKAACPDAKTKDWECGLEVVAPFGSDTLVAVTTSGDPTSLIEWLRKHVDRRDGPEAPEVVAKLLHDDPAARAGFTSVVTRAEGY